MNKMINKGLFTSKKDDRSTPDDLFNKLNKKYHFTLDPASTHENAKCKKHFTKEEDGLKQDRTGETIRLNPPYGKEIKDRIEKAYYSVKYGKETKAILLLPARTDTKRFHEYIYKKDNVKIEFLKGRLKFGSSKNSAPFPSMLVFYNL